MARVIPHEGPEMKGDTKYSKKIPGTVGNYGWSVRYAKTDGYVLVYQEKEYVTEAVLLSPAQLDKLIAFASPPAKRRSTKKVARIAKGEAKRARKAARR
jgi:hypothetical protein